MHTPNFIWTRHPAEYTVSPDRIEIITEPRTDLWQKTYYHFINDSAPLLQTDVPDRLFTFCVKTEFDSKVRFDQCGVIVYVDSENWIKASVEYESDTMQRLGSVVTNDGWSDWATQNIPGDIQTMWYRLSRRGNDFLIEASADGTEYEQIRMCHLRKASGTVPVGVYACSPEDSSFRAVFTQIELGPCKWKAHDGQAPDAGAEWTES